MGSAGASAPKRRVLVVTRNLPPMRGGMERVNHHLLGELATGFEVQACCPQDSREFLPAGVGGVTVPLQPVARFLVSSALVSLRLARRFRPDLVLAGSGLTVPAAQMAAAAAGCRCAAYLHGLDVVAPSALYQWAWVRRFAALDAVIANSRSTASLATRAGVTASRISLVHPGIRLPAWEPSSGDAFRERFEIGQRPILLCLGRLTARKGIAEFVERVMPAVVAERPDALLAIIGGEAAQSLKRDRGSQVQRIRRLVEHLGLQSNVRLLGELEDPWVDAAMFASRALVFPVLDLPGDSEGFGMVAVEAAAHGVPTVGFAVGGVVDAVAEPDTGWLLPSGDYAAMRRVLCALLAAPAESDARRYSRRAFAARFEWAEFGAKVRGICARLIAGTAGAASFV